MKKYFGLFFICLVIFTTSAMAQNASKTVFTEEATNYRLKLFLDNCLKLSTQESIQQLDRLYKRATGPDGTIFWPVKNEHGTNIIIRNSKADNGTTCGIFLMESDIKNKIGDWLKLHYPNNKVIYEGSNGINNSNYSFYRVASDKEGIPDTVLFLQEKNGSPKYNSLNAYLAPKGSFDGSKLKK